MVTEKPFDQGPSNRIGGLCQGMKLNDDVFELV
jgi:hypothetical protein